LLDFKNVKEKDYIRQVQSTIRAHENADYFRKQGIEVLIGTAKFVDKRKLKVDGVIYTAKKIVIATGSLPAKLDIPGIDKVQWVDNTNVFDLKTVRERLLVIGGGPIGLELGQAFSRLGAL